MVSLLFFPLSVHDIRLCIIAIFPFIMGFLSMPFSPTFLVACTRLYRSPCRSVGRSVRPSVGPSVTLSLREQFMHYRPCPTTCDWSCRVYGTPLCPCPPPYRSCPPGPPKGGSPLLPNWTRAVFALLPLPNKLEQMLSCIQHLFPAPAHHLLPLPNRTRLMPGRVSGLVFFFFSYPAPNQELKKCF